MTASVRFSFSCRGISKDVSDDELTSFFNGYGSIVSLKHVPPLTGYKTGMAYVNFSSVLNTSDILALNNSVPSFNKGRPITVRQQEVLVAQVANAISEIRFSVSIRGVTIDASEAQIRETLSDFGKIHSIKMTEVPPWVVRNNKPL